MPGGKALVAKRDLGHGALEYEALSEASGYPREALLRSVARDREEMPPGRRGDPGHLQPAMVEVRRAQLRLPPGGGRLARLQQRCGNLFPHPAGGGAFPAAPRGYPGGGTRKDYRETINSY